MNPTYEEIKAQAALTPEQNTAIENAKSPAITSESLKAETALVVPETPTSTVADGITGFTQGLTDQARAAAKVQADLESQQREAASRLEESRVKKTSLMDSIIRTNASRPEVEKEFKIEEKATKYTDITNQLEASQRAQTNELRALSGSGLTDVQKTTKTREINRGYAFEQADLALLQSAANRDLLTAQTLADRRIELQLEPLKLQLDFEREFYAENKDDFDKADERAFANKIKESERAYEEARTTAKTLQDTKLSLLASAAEQGASSVILSAIQKAKTPDEAIRAAGQYGGDVLSREIQKQQLENLKQDYSKTAKEMATLDVSDGTLTEKDIKIIDDSTEGKKLKTLGSLKLKLDSYTELVNKYGTETGRFGAGQKNELDAAYADLKIAYKTAAELGALQGPDIVLLEQAIKPATFDSSFKRFGSTLFGSGKKSIVSGLTQANSILNKEATRSAEILSAKNPKYAGSNYFQTLTLPFEQVTEDPLGINGGTTATESNPLGI